MGHVVRYARRRALPPDPVPDLEGLDIDRAAAIIAEALDSGGGCVSPAETKALPQSYGFPLAETITAISPSAAAHAAEQLDGYVVQAEVTEGHELLVGVPGDPAFGPLVAVGAGGTAAELMHDVQVRLAPIGRREADEMLRSLRTFPLLEQSCRQSSLTLRAIQDVLLRAGALAAAHPEIAELDCNPVIAGDLAVVVIDARVRIAPPPPIHHYGALDA